MVVKVPECVHVIDFEASDLAALQTVIGGELHRRGVCAWTGFLEQTLGEEVAPHGGVRGRRLIGAEDCAQVVVVQLAGRTGMVAILHGNGFDQCGQETALLSRIDPNTGLEGGHRILGGAACNAQPSFNRGQTEANGCAGSGMTPGLGAQSGQGGVQFPRCRRRGKQRPDDREAQPRPSIAVLRITALTHHDSLPCGEPLATHGDRDYKCEGDAAITIFCGRRREVQRPSLSVLRGLRKCSDWIRRVARSEPAKRVSGLAGSMAMETGGMKQAPADCQKGLSTNSSSHLRRQRSTVR